MPSNKFYMPMDEFERRANEIHSFKYIYIKVIYAGANVRVEIVCSCHGSFWQTPASHLNGQGCRKCYDESRIKGIAWFIERATILHAGKYDYSKSIYIRSKDKLEIICHDHGSFWQSPNHHLCGKGCPKCARELTIMNLVFIKSLTRESFSVMAGIIHNNFYRYEKVIYIGNKDPVEIICPLHGSFWQAPNPHLRGSGCPKCGKEKRRKANLSNTDEFIRRSIIIHGNTYDYSKAIYITSKTKIEIICHKHGSFLQTPNAHLNGHGCSSCFESFGETTIAETLDANNIRYEREKTFPGMRNEHPLFLDFWLPDLKIAVEYQGQQHFMPVKHWQGEEGFTLNKRRDQIKRNFCTEKGLRLIEIPYTVKDIENFLLTELHI